MDDDNVGYAFNIITLNASESCSTQAVLLLEKIGTLYIYLIIYFLISLYYSKSSFIQIFIN